MSLSWKPIAVGDILVGTQDQPVIASWFGNGIRTDPTDNGETASGIPTTGNPTLEGCALPMPTSPATKGSPLPIMPYRTTLVQIWRLLPSGIVISTTVPILDDGPALDAPDHAAIDLTQTSFKNLQGDLDEGLIKVWFKIIGGAKYLLPQ